LGVDGTVQSARAFAQIAQNATTSAARIHPRNPDKIASRRLHSARDLAAAGMGGHERLNQPPSCAAKRKPGRRKSCDTTPAAREKARATACLPATVSCRSTSAVCPSHDHAMDKGSATGERIALDERSKEGCRKSLFPRTPPGEGCHRFMVSDKSGAAHFVRCSLMAWRELARWTCLAP